MLGLKVLGRAHLVELSLGLGNRRGVRLDLGVSLVPIGDLFFLALDHVEVAAGEMQAPNALGLCQVSPGGVPRNHAVELDLLLMPCPLVVALLFVQRALGFIEALALLALGLKCCRAAGEADEIVAYLLWAEATRVHLQQRRR